MFEFDKDAITIVTKDANGEKHVKEFVTESAAVRWIKRGNLEDEKILIVAQGGLCLYSALSADRELTADDLVEFFS